MAIGCVSLALTVGCATDHRPAPATPVLSQLATLNETARADLTTSYCVDGCRYDRTSPERKTFIREENGEAVIFEASGGGSIVRIWMTTGHGISRPLPEQVNIKIYLDDADSAVIHTPLTSFFDGSDPRWPFPIAGNRSHSSGGNYNLTEFTFDEYARVSLTAAEEETIWYQVNSTSENQSFHHDQQNFVNFLSQPGYAGPMGYKKVIHVPALGVTPVHFPRGPASISSWSLASSQRPESITLSWRFDAFDAVSDLPLLDYFALGDIDAVNKSRLIGKAGSVYYDNFSKPYSKSAVLFVRNASATNEELTLEYDLSRASPNGEVGYFSAKSLSACPSSPSSDYDIVDFRADRGRWTGIFQVIDSIDTQRRDYLEGDETAFFGGESEARWRGTGVEDLYSGGFYFDQGPFSLPTHGATFHHRSEKRDVTGMYRWMLADHVPFDTALVVKQEAGPTGQTQLCARSVAYGYLLPEEDPGAQSLPAASDPTQSGRAD